MIKTEKSEAVMEFLKSDPIINLNILGIIENIPEAEIFVDDRQHPKGILVRYGYFHCIYTKEDAFIEEAISTFFKERGAYGFSAVEASIAEKIKRRFEIEWEEPCQLYYMPPENLNTSLIKNTVQPIVLKDAETIDQYYTYRDEESLEVIQADIIKRPSSAIYIDGELVCWVLIHEDNSMGIMYTKEAHRNKGYAVDVTTDLAAQVINSGGTPFVHIAEGNHMSPGLARKCGFLEYGPVVWFGILVGLTKEDLENI